MKPHLSGKIRKGGIGEPLLVPRNAVGVVRVRLSYTKTASVVFPSRTQRPRGQGMSAPRSGYDWPSFPPLSRRNATTRTKNPDKNADNARGKSNALLRPTSKLSTPQRDRAFEQKVLNTPQKEALRTSNTFIIRDEPVENEQKRRRNVVNRAKPCQKGLDTTRTKRIPGKAKTVSDTIPARLRHPHAQSRRHSH